MIFQSIKRVFKWGAIGFVRNSTVSFSAVLVMVVALIMIGSTILTNAGLKATLAALEDKVDINVYFKVDAPEADVLAMQHSLETLPEVASVTYTTKEQALADFQERHKDDPLTLQALKELNANPFGAILTVKATSPSQYDAIGAALAAKSDASADGTTASIIDRDNYQNKKPMIDTLNDIMGKIRFWGLVLAIVLVLISILITFNTIRLAIYISKDEIGVMRLVGAGKAYIRGPFIIEGALYGIVAALVSTGLFYAITLTIKKQTQNLFGGIDPFKYYISNFNEIFLVIFCSGVALGVVSSYLAVRKYLKD